MTKTMSRPEILLLLLIVPVMLWAVLIGDAIDIHLHDTYFVIGPYFLTCWLTALIALEALIYFLTRGFRQSGVLQKIHVYGLAFFIGLVFFMLAYGGNDEPARYYNDYGNLDSAFARSKMISMLALVGMLVFLTAHLVFITNLIAGFIKGKKATL